MIQLPNRRWAHKILPLMEVLRERGEIDRKGLCEEFNMKYSQLDYLLVRMKELEIIETKRRWDDGKFMHSTVVVTDKPVVIKED